jgi:transcriptional regulator with XRE-family HTH domain
MSVAVDNPQHPSDTALQPFQSDPPAKDDSAPQYSRVGPEKAAEIVRLKRIRPSITQQEIADALGIGIATVSRWLSALDNDTVKEARQLAKSQALRATMKIADQVDHSDPRVSLGASKAVVALAGVQEGSAQVSVGVQVIVGSQTQPAGPDPFETISATVVESES